MLERDDAWPLDEEVPLEEPADVIRTMPEIRQLAAPDRRDDELGLRSILARPEALFEAWRHVACSQQRRRPAKSATRHAGAVRST
jgi:hypothetical protein